MDELIRGKMHDALDAIEPPPALRALHSIPAERGATARASQPVRFEWALGVIAALLALAIISGLLYTRGLHQLVPGNPVVAPTTPPRPVSGMISPIVGWSLGPAGHVFRTADGGRTWKDVTPAGYASSFVAPFFMDAGRAWITGDAGSTGTVVFRTNDGGASWQRAAAFTVAGLHARGAMSLFFLDSEHGWLMGNSVNPVLAAPDRVEFQFVYRTADGGSSWQRVGDTRTNRPACPWSGFAFSSRTTGWLTTYCGPSGGRPELLVSHDGGSTWEAQPLPSMTGVGSYLRPPRFFDAAHGLLAADTDGSGSALFATTDGGLTWTRRDLPGQLLIAEDFVDPEHGWVIAGPAELARNDPSSNGLPLPLYQTNDGGLTWQRISNNLTIVTPSGRIQDIYFVNRRSGFAIASESLPYTSGPATLFATSDGGATWTQVGQIPSQAGCVPLGCDSAGLQ